MTARMRAVARRATSDDVQPVVTFGKTTVDLAARRNAEAARSNAEAETLSTLAGSLLRGEQALPALLERIQETFAVGSVTLLRRDTGAPASAGRARADGSSGGLRGTWTCVASVGDDPCLSPEDGDTEVPVGDTLTLVLRGRPLAAEDQRVLAAFATQAAVAYRQRQLSEAAAAAIPIAQADRMRTALLNAVSHDLRTPIASAKAAVSSLLNSDVSWTEADQHDLLADADGALDVLTTLVGNLLDVSRLQAGALAVQVAPVGLDDVVSRVLDQVQHADRIELAVSPALPEVLADPPLLERAIANLAENALRYSPVGRPVRIAASAHADIVEVRVVDHGPGIAIADRGTVFEPFQRRVDHVLSGGGGVGLGLAIARGFVEAMGGSIDLDETPGGGLTTVVRLRRAPGPVEAGAVPPAPVLNRTAPLRP